MIGRFTVVVALSAGMLTAPPSVHAVHAAYAAPAEGEAAGAEDPKIERAKELLENGANLYNEGSYEAAILAFQEGYDLTEEPAFLYNIGNCYERLGNFGEARKYRAFAPEGEREILARRITALDERIRKQREAEAKGEELDEEPPPPVEPKPMDEGEKPPPEPAKKDRIYGPAAMALTGVAAVGLGIGIGFGVKANNERQTALDNCVEQGGGYLCSDAAQAALDQRKSSALVADIGFVIAGAAAIGVVSAIAIKASQRKKRGSADDAIARRRSRLTPYASGRGAGFVLTGRF
jgi:tetratricopeptide (TPR) repeat protein